MHFGIELLEPGSTLTPPVAQKLHRLHLHILQWSVAKSDEQKSSQRSVSLSSLIPEWQTAPQRQNWQPLHLQCVQWSSR